MAQDHIWGSEDNDGHKGGPATTSAQPGNKRSLDVDAPPQRIEVDEADPNNIYIGFAEPGALTSAAVWKIMAVITSGTTTSLKFADGNYMADNIWDDRAGLSYS